MTRYEAYIVKNWREVGLAHLIVARWRDTGDADYGVFLVDMWCLGVKDAFGETGVPDSALREFLDQRLPEKMREAMHPACAKKLIEGGVAYAESLGFAPHRDFRKARRVLSGIDAALCPKEFDFGRDGRPCFVPGEDDSEERIDRVLAMLEARLGEDGFDYEAEEDDVGTLREELKEWLEAEPEEVPRFFFLSGLLTAMQACPQPLSPAKAFDVLWPEGREWESAEEIREFTDLLSGYWNYLANRIAVAAQKPVVPAGEADPATVIDIWEADLPEEEAGKDYDSLPFMAAMFEWSRGFWKATQAWPEAFGGALTRPELAADWEIVRCWADLLRPENRASIGAAAEEPVPRNLGRSVNALVRALRAPK